MERLVSVLNELFGTLKINYYDINRRIPLKDLSDEQSFELEKKFPEIVLGFHDGSFTLSSIGLLNTALKLATGKVLKFKVDSDTKIITGVELT